MQIDYLASHTDFIPEIAEWLFGEWGYRSPQSSVDRVIRRLQQKATKDIPLSLIAIVEKNPIGVISLVDKEEEDDSDGPWISGVYVIPSERWKWIASELLRRAECEAIRLWCKKLLLSATVPSLYEELGYRLTPDTKHGGEPIMIKYLR